MYYGNPNDSMHYRAEYFGEEDINFDGSDNELHFKGIEIELESEGNLGQLPEYPPAGVFQAH